MKGAPTLLNQVALYSGWLLLSILAAFAAWQLHTALLIVVASWLSSELPRPLGWTQAMLVPISKLSLFTFGSLWLGLMLYMERSLFHSLRRGRAQQRLFSYLFAISLSLLLAYLAILFVP